MGFEIHQDKAGQWRWRLRATNGQLLANGGQAFASKVNVIRSLESVRKLVAESPDHKELPEDDTDA